MHIRLLMHCRQHGSIPRDDRSLALISHCDTRLWHRYRETVLQFFDVVDASTMSNKRVASERLRAEQISNRRKGAARQMLSKRRANAEHLRTQLQSESQ
ncbi:MAG: YdaU family protein [Xanthobacteraceae bacterium]|nr:YdaU family protein [Xanthobacteraceae bacterium]